MSLADTVTVMAQRLRERLQKCNGDAVLKAEAATTVQRFTEWALNCIGSQARPGKGSRLTRKDYTEAFDTASFPLTLFSSAINPGWATGIATSAMQGLLGLLVEGGAHNVNQCFLEAARFGSTELVRILLPGFVDADMNVYLCPHCTKECCGVGCGLSFGICLPLL